MPLPDDPSNSTSQNSFRKVWVSGSIRCNYKRSIRRSKNNTEHNVGEDCKAKLKGERKIAEKVKELEIFQAQKEQEVTEKFSRASRSDLLTKTADISQRDLMNSQPQCSPGKVEVRCQKDRNLPQGGENMLEEITLTQDQPKCNEPVMPPSTPGRQL